MRKAVSEPARGHDALERSSHSHVDDVQILDLKAITRFCWMGRLKACDKKIVDCLYMKAHALITTQANGCNENQLQREFGR